NNLSIYSTTIYSIIILVSLISLNCKEATLSYTRNLHLTRHSLPVTVLTPVTVLPHFTKKIQILNTMLIPRTYFCGEIHLI
ncbi:MAG: hypothetical protein ACOCWZ_08970, partial [Spirochaetota bacterium]